MSADSRINQENKHLHEIDAALDHAQQHIDEAARKAKEPPDGHLLPTEDEQPLPTEDDIKI